MRWHEVEFVQQKQYMKLYRYSIDGNKKKLSTRKQTNDNNGLCGSNEIQSQYLIRWKFNVIHLLK